VDFLGKTSLVGYDVADHFLVEEDVVVENQNTPYTTARVILHRKGSYISLSRAREIGLIK
jgi:hypothetical protein